MQETILLTGLPTLLSKQIAREVLLQSESRLIAVVRKKFWADTEHFVNTLPHEQSSRVTLLEGDVASMDFGLSGQELRQLSLVTTIHHAAQVTYFGVDAQAADWVNVRGTKEALEIAKLCPKLASFVHHSTAYVSGAKQGQVDECPYDHHAQTRNVVEASKRKAELLVWNARSWAPVVIVRPSTVIGHSVTGEVDRLDGPYLLVLLLLASPVELALPLPTLDNARLNLVPVDYVARAAVSLGRNPQALGRIVHLVDRKPRNAAQTFELIAHATGRRLAKGYIPANVTKALLRAPGLEKLLKSPRAFVDQLVTPVTFGTEIADFLLTAQGIEAPPFESYVDRMVQAVRTRIVSEKHSSDEPEVEDPLV